MEYWEWDTATDRVRRYPSPATTTGLNLDGEWHSAAEGLALHPDDRERHAAMAAAALRKRKGWHTEVRIVSPETGETRWIEERAAPGHNPADGDFRLIGFRWDITERKRAEAARQDADEKYRTMFDLIDEGFCVIEVIEEGEDGALDYRFLETNASFERQTGLVHASGRRMREMEPHHEEHWFQRYARIARTRTPERFEDRAEALGRWYDVYAFPIGAPALRRVGILFRDVIERKRAEQALARSNHLLQTTFDSSLQIIQLFKAVRDEQGAIIDFEWELTNKQWNDRWGSNVGKRLLAENPAVVESGIWDKFLEVMETGEPITHEHYYNHEQFDGWFLQTVAKAEDGILLSTSDITDRKRAEIASRESEAKLAHLVEALPIGIGLIDTRGEVTLANTAFRALVPRAVPSRDAATLPLWRAWDAAGVPLGKEQFPTTRALRGENVLPGQEMLYGPEGGTQIWMQVSAVPMRDEGGEVVGTVSALVDIDALKRSEAALRQSEERQAFLLKVSDTLRPLADARDIADNACRLLVELLSAGQAQYADIKGEPGGEMGAVCGEYVGSGEPFPRRFSLAPFGEPVLQTLRAARSLVISDVETDTRLDAAQRESFHAVKAPAVISVPLVKEGRWIAALTLQDIHARDWTATDIDLVESVAERTWSAIERARAERAIEERDARYRDLFERMDEGFAEMEAVRDHEGIVTDFRHLARNPASERVTGLPTEQVLGRLVGEVLPPEDARYWIDAYAKVLASGQPERFEHYIPALGRWFGVNVTLYGDDGVGVFYENITTRKRAEQTLRESEERFQQFADASSAGLWIRDASTLTMEYVSRAVPNIYGVPPENFLGPIEQWASHIVPEDRDAALEHIEQARQGNSVVHEFRIQRPSDLAFRWIRNTDFPLRDPAGNVQRIGGLAEDVTETKRLQEHQGVLLAELQHRVRNIMAMIRSMANRGGDGSRTVEDYRQVLTGRLLALARVQTLLTRQSDTGGPLRGVIESEISAQADHDGQYELIGSDVTLSPKAMEVLTLAFHELATNALKYGALSVPGGRVSVTWSAVEKNGLPWLVLDWIEEGAPLRAPPTRRGFGTELIEGKIPYELGGVGKISFEAGGARCHFELPLREGKSILETDSPVATLVFGGALDMSGAPDLTGQRVLIIEDDYYLASDTSAALRGAGAQVIGPCPREDLALRLLEEQAPTAAVVDINLGGGPRFAVAEHLRSRHVPFVFLTGYDAGVIPEVFANIRRLQKPIALRDVVEAVSELKAKAAA